MPMSATTQDNLQTLLDNRNKAIDECRKIADKAKAENRQMNAEEKASFNAAKANADKNKKEYEDGLQEQKDMEWLEDAQNSLDLPAGGRVTNPQAHAGGGSGSGGFVRPKTLNWNPTDRFASPVFRNRMCNRIITLEGERAQAKYHDSFTRYLNTGNERSFTKAGFDANTYLAEQPRNGMRADDEEKGGYFIASEEFVAGLLKNVDDQTFVQGLSRVLMVRQARNLGIFRRTAKFRAWNWGSELSDVSRNLDTSLKYGKKELTPHYITGAARISRDLMRSSAMPIESMVMDEASIDLSEILEQAYLYGTGNQRPLGVMVASNDGISTARDSAAIDLDVNTTAGEDSTTHFGFNSLIRAKYALKLKYRSKARWMFHRDTISRISQIRDNNGQYIWQPSKVVGDPDTVLGLAMDESEWMPNTFTTGLYYGILADWSNYWIAIGLELEVLRLNEMRARQNEVEYLMRLKVDAMPVLEEAFVRLKLAAA